MSYSFIDGLGAVQTAESSVVVGTAQRQVVTIGSVLTAIPTTFSGNITIGSILSSNVPNQSVSGTVVVGGGQSSVSGVGIFNVNPLGNGSIIAQLTTSSVAALQGTNPWVIGNSSVMLTQGTNTIGSVTAIQGTNPWVIGNSSVQVVGIMPPQSVSGVGLFNINNVGNGSIFTGFRNDALASTIGVDLTSRLIATDSAGRTVIKPFAPEEARIQSVISATAGTTSLLAAGGAGLRTYITDAFLTNTSSTATIVSFLDGDNSVIGRTIAPATGGSNMVGLATPMRTGGFNHIIQVQMVPITSTLGVTALGYKAP